MFETNNIIKYIMSFFQKQINNLSPYYFARKYPINSDNIPLFLLTWLSAIRKYYFTASMFELDLNMNFFYKEILFFAHKAKGFKCYYESKEYDIWLKKMS